MNLMRSFFPQDLRPFVFAHHSIATRTHVAGRVTRTHGRKVSVTSRSVSSSSTLRTRRAPLDRVCFIRDTRRAAQVGKSRRECALRQENFPWGLHEKRQKKGYSTLPHQKTKTFGRRPSRYTHPALPSLRQRSRRRRRDTPALQSASLSSDG